MAVKDDDPLKNIIEGLGGIVAPATLATDPEKMLAAIRNASLIRLGIGLQTKERAGESAYTKLGEVAESASDMLEDYTKIVAAQGTTSKELSTEFGKAQTSYNKLFFVPDEYTGALKQLRQDFMTLGIQPPSQEFFKNNLFTKEYFLGDTGHGDNYIDFHKDQVKTAQDKGQTPPTWEESFNTYNIIRNTG